MSISVDWKHEGAVQVKIRDIKQKIIILIGWKPERAIYAKVLDYDKITASDQTSLTWGPLAVRVPPIWSILNSGIQSC